MERLGADKPDNAWGLGARNFDRELRQLLLAARGGPLADLAAQVEEALGIKGTELPLSPPDFVERLTLDAEKVARREEKRGVPESTPVVKGFFHSLCWALDRFYEGRPIQKFWVLETVARMPYFSYVTVLHLYESLGWWRTPQIRAIHNAEEDNELHHLLIMESLGGNCLWVDRFLAQQASVAYYWLVVLLFLVDPKLAYNFSLLVEEHAHVTYAQFVEENAELLRQVPPPPIAVQYYLSGDLSLFDKFHTGPEHDGQPVRRPPCGNLLDVFQNIRDDELEHVSTMRACQSWWAGDGPPPFRASELNAFGKRGDWQAWAAEVNAMAKKPGAQETQEAQEALSP